jgi:tRNA1Val (adenine37-N6)-methyltransferase
VLKTILLADMSNKYFRFKQFTVYQDRCAMKVGTDGMLLGAWAEVSGCRRILDVGAGTGLIALMMAQRCSEAVIDAVEIDNEAYMQAKSNIEASPFADRINIFNAAFQDFARTATAAYDLIISNPPFFVSSLKSPVYKRNIARHDERLPLRELFEAAKLRLAPEGRIALIVPAPQHIDTEDIASATGLFCIRRTFVIPVLGKEVKRMMAEWSLRKTEDMTTEFLPLQDADGVRTAEYCELTKEFFYH